jgi:hypothetical protein
VPEKLTPESSRNLKQKGRHKKNFQCFAEFLKFAMEIARCLTETFTQFTGT